MNRAGAGCLLLVAGLSGFVAGCGDGGDDEVLRVFAAASLTDAFDEIATAFEAEHPGVEVSLVLAGSSSLREQVLAGAPAEVIAVADDSALEPLLDAGLVAPPVVFATNRLVVAVPADDPGNVDGLADLADPSLLVGLCAPQVPCGALARAAFEQAGVTPSPDSEEPDVRALLTKLVAGELDAGVVYATDVAAAKGSVTAIELPAGVEVAARYPIAAVTDAEGEALASDFIAFVLGPTGQAILAEHGFGPP